MSGSEHTPYIFYFKFKVAVSKLLFILYCAKSTLKNDKKYIVAQLTKVSPLKTAEITKFQ